MILLIFVAFLATNFVLATPGLTTATQATGNRNCSCVCENEDRPRQLPELPEPEPTNFTRCGHLEKCGDCVAEYMCSWCATETDGPAGYCVDESAPSEAAVCRAEKGGQVSKTCTCQGWTNCNDCGTHGCSWCGNGGNDFCFYLGSHEQLRSCLNSGTDLTFNDCNNNQPHYLKVDPTGEITPKLLEHVPSEETPQNNQVTGLLIAILVLLVLLTILSLGGLLVCVIINKSK